MFTLEYFSRQGDQGVIVGDITDGKGRIVFPVASSKKKPKVIVNTTDCQNSVVNRNNISLVLKIFDKKGSPCLGTTRVLLRYDL